MSTQQPFESQPVACATNWYTQLACRVQALVEPLCERRSDFTLNAYEENMLMGELGALAPAQFATAIGCHGTSSAVFAAIAEWEAANHQTIALSPEARAVLAPRLTPWNRVGVGLWKVFSVGTTCNCCLAYRVIALALLSGGVGFILGR